MKFLAVILCIQYFTLVYSSGQYLLSSSYFIKQGHVSETTDLGVFAVYKLEIPSLVECALQCGMHFLCNAFDLCFLKGLYICRFRSGHANLTNATTQCELFENTTNKSCHNGALLGAQGPCEIILPNIALRKPAEQSSTHFDYNATYAVDGNRGTNIGVDKCTVTRDGDKYPWWRVDLQAVYTITSVRILNREIDNLYGTDMSFRLHDVTVTVGLTESDISTPCGFFAGPGTASQLVVIDCPTSTQGRFVKISKTTEALTLCEVDVCGVPV
ncbi:fucolectin-1-like [Crassostrea angulata]|uniref:fucolectin-1-like n=1 Tax=Magallana angulata TaxID=2784310 RepID=UPI0022B0EFBD|nr:fucolectin-1-like [Crassostrea angulata]